MTLTTPAKKDCLRESGAFAWVVVIALGLMSAGTTGTYSIIAGSFVAPVCEDLGFDYTSFSFYFTAILLGLALGLPLLSRFIPKVIGKPWHICIELVLILHRGLDVHRLRRSDRHLLFVYNGRLHVRCH